MIGQPTSSQTRLTLGSEAIELHCAISTPTRVMLIDWDEPFHVSPKDPAAR